MFAKELIQSSLSQNHWIPLIDSHLCTEWFMFSARTKFWSQIAPFSAMWLQSWYMMY